MNQEQNILWCRYNYNAMIYEYLISAAKQFIFPSIREKNQTRWVIMTDQTCWVLGEDTAGFPMKTWLS